MHKAVLQGDVKSHGWHNVKLIDWALLKANQQFDEAADDTTIQEIAGPRHITLLISTGIVCLC